MEYCISIEDLCLDAIVGILPFERTKTQRIRITAEFVYVSNGDNFLDYSKLRDCIKEAFLKEFALLEDAQMYFLQEIPQRFPQIKEYWIKITKLEIFKDCKVGIKFTYKKDCYGTTN